jgi:hypothetical protein
MRTSNNDGSASNDCCCDKFNCSVSDYDCSVSDYDCSVSDYDCSVSDNNDCCPDYYYNDNYNNDNYNNDACASCLPGGSDGAWWRHSVL